MPHRKLFIFTALLSVCTHLLYAPIQVKESETRPAEYFTFDPDAYRNWLTKQKPTTFLVKKPRRKECTSYGQFKKAENAWKTRRNVANIRNGYGYKRAIESSIATGEAHEQRVINTLTDAVEKYSFINSDQVLCDFINELHPLLAEADEHNFATPTHAAMPQSLLLYHVTKAYKFLHQNKELFPKDFLNHPITQLIIAMSNLKHPRH